MGPYTLLLAIISQKKDSLIASSFFTFIVGQTAASVPSRAAAVPTCPSTNLQDYNSPKKMVARFADISDEGDTLLTNYLQVRIMNRTLPMIIFLDV